MQVKKSTFCRVKKSAFSVQVRWRAVSECVLSVACGHAEPGFVCFSLIYGICSDEAVYLYNFRLIFDKKRKKEF